MKPAAILGAIAAAAVATLLIGPFTFYAALVPVLGPVLPRPPAVPPEAAASYEWKASGMNWRWRRPLPHGCATWYATDDFARVDLSRDDRLCADAGPGRKLSYTSFAEEIVFDPGGGGLGGEPCPYAVSDTEVAALRVLVAEAGRAAMTAGERAVLRHVEQRLTRVDGSALTTDHSGGCNDLKPADYRRPATHRHVDPWES